MTDTIRVAAYARSATAPDNEAIQRQIQRCQDEAERKGWSLCQVFQDEGISGNSDDRTGLNALRSGFHENQLDVVLVESADRLFRDLVLIRDFLELAEEFGIEVRISEQKRSLSSRELPQLGRRIHILRGMEHNK